MCDEFYFPIARSNMFLHRIFLAYALCIITSSSVTYTMDENKNCCKVLVTRAKKIAKIPGNIIMLSSSIEDLPLIYIFAKIENPLLNNNILYKERVQKSFNTTTSFLINIRPYIIAKCLYADCGANLIINPLSSAIEQHKNNWVQFYLDHG